MVWLGLLRLIVILNFGNDSYPVGDAEGHDGSEIVESVTGEVIDSPHQPATLVPHISRARFSSVAGMINQ
jgi:hypothetical protein